MSPINKFNFTKTFLQLFFRYRWITNCTASLLWTILEIALLPLILKRKLSQYLILFGDSVIWNNYSLINIFSYRNSSTKLVTSMLRQYFPLVPFRRFLTRRATRMLALRELAQSSPSQSAAYSSWVHGTALAHGIVFWKARFWNKAIHRVTNNGEELCNGYCRRLGCLLIRGCWELPHLWGEVEWSKDDTWRYYEVMYEVDENGAVGFQWDCSVS